MRKENANFCKIVLLVLLMAVSFGCSTTQTTKAADGSQTTTTASDPAATAANLQAWVLGIDVHVGGHAAKTLSLFVPNAKGDHGANALEAQTSFHFSIHLLRVRNTGVPDFLKLTGLNQHFHRVAVFLSQGQEFYPRALKR